MLKQKAETGVLVFLLVLASILPLTGGYAQTEDDYHHLEVGYSWQYKGEAPSDPSYWMTINRTVTGMEDGNYIIRNMITGVSDHDQSIVGSYGDALILKTSDELMFVRARVEPPDQWWLGDPGPTPPWWGKYILGVISPSTDLTFDLLMYKYEPFRDYKILELPLKAGMPPWDYKRDLDFGVIETRFMYGEEVLAKYTMKFSESVSVEEGGKVTVSVKGGGEVTVPALKVIRDHKTVKRWEDPDDPRGWMVLDKHEVTTEWYALNVGLVKSEYNAIKVTRTAQGMDPEKGTIEKFGPQDETDSYASGISRLVEINFMPKVEITCRFVRDFVNVTQSVSLDLEVGTLIIVVKDAITKKEIEDVIVEVIGGPEDVKGKTYVTDDAGTVVLTIDPMELRSHTWEVFLGGAAITLDSSFAPAGAGIKVSCTGFTPHESVSIKWDSETGVELGSTTANEDGNFEKEITVPEEAKGGEHTIYAIGEEHSPRNIATATVIVIEGLRITIYEPEDGQTFTQGDDFYVWGKVEGWYYFETIGAGTTKLYILLKGAEVVIRITSPTRKEYGWAPIGYTKKPMASAITDSEGEFKWEGFFTVDASTDEWSLKVEASFKGLKDESDPLKFNVKKYVISDAKRELNMDTIIRMWKKDPTTLRGKDSWGIYLLMWPRGPKLNLFISSGLAPEDWSEYTCSAHAERTLKFLNGIRFNDLKDTRLFMAGLDYGPIVDITGFTHIAVVIYPSEPILGWRVYGKVFEPWFDQEIEVWSAIRWIKVFGGVLCRGASGVAAYTGAYPITGGDGYYPDLHAGYPSSVVSEARAGRILSYSPVDVLVTDAQGCRIGRLLNGTIVREVPDAYLMVATENNTSVYYLILPEGKYDVMLTGTDEGFSHLLTSSTGNEVMDYGEYSMTRGAQAHLTLDPENPLTPLAMPDGSQVLPTTIHKLLEVALTLSSIEIQLGDQIKMDGKVTPAQTDASVTVLYSTDGSTWKTLTTVACRPDGSYEYTWTPPSDGTYYLKATYREEESAVTQLTVVPKPTPFPDWFTEWFFFLIPVIKPILQYVPHVLVPYVPYTVVGLPAILFLLASALLLRRRRATPTPPPPYRPPPAKELPEVKPKVEEILRPTVAVPEPPPRLKGERPKVCENCHAVFWKGTTYNTAALILLLIFYVLPGLIYWWVKRKEKCPRCGKKEWHMASEAEVEEAKAKGDVVWKK